MAFESTNVHAGGRTIRVAVFPLIADLPALQKTAGFGSHAASLFCSFCLLAKEDLEETDMRKFVSRTDEVHLQDASDWQKLSNSTEGKKFSKQKGARWSILNDLPYWRPIQHCSIELMHALVVELSVSLLP